MTQNTSSAVMQQRTEAHDSLDDFPTPPWATRALIEHVLSGRLYLGSVWEPCSNRGYMAKALREYFKRVHTSDIHDYSNEPCVEIQDRVVDFLWEGSESPVIAANGVDWIITNPPFRLAEQIITRGLQFGNVAVLVRTAFLEGGDRYVRLFKSNPPTIFAPFVERVIMHKGKMRDPSRLYWTGTEWRRPSTATSYCWLVWIRGADRQPPVWIPPCRRQLERPGDYPNG